MPFLAKFCDHANIARPSLFFYLRAKLGTHKLNSCRQVTYTVCLQTHTHTHTQNPSMSGAPNGMLWCHQLNLSAVYIGRIINASVPLFVSPVYIHCCAEWRWNAAAEIVDYWRHLDVILCLSGATSFLGRRDPLWGRLRQLQQTLKYNKDVLRVSKAKPCIIIFKTISTYMYVFVCIEVITHEDTTFNMWPKPLEQDLVIRHLSETQSIVAGITVRLVDDPHGDDGDQRHGGDGHEPAEGLRPRGQLVVAHRQRCRVVDVVCKNSL